MYYVFFGKEIFNYSYEIIERLKRKEKNVKFYRPGVPNSKTDPATLYSLSPSEQLLVLSKIGFLAYLAQELGHHKDRNCPQKDLRKNDLRFLFYNWTKTKNTFFFLEQKLIALLQRIQGCPAGL